MKNRRGGAFDALQAGITTEDENLPPVHRQAYGLGLWLREKCAAWLTTNRSKETAQTIADREYRSPLEKRAEHEAPLLKLVDGILDDLVCSRARCARFDCIPMSAEAQEIFQNPIEEEGRRQLRELLENERQEIIRLHNREDFDPDEFDECLENDVPYVIGGFIFGYSSRHVRLGVFQGNRLRPKILNEVPQSLADPIQRVLKMKAGLDPGASEGSGLLVHLSNQRTTGRRLGLYQLTIESAGLGLLLKKQEDRLANRLFAAEPAVWSVKGFWQRVPQDEAEFLSSSAHDRTEYDELGRLYDPGRDARKEQELAEAEEQADSGDEITPSEIDLDESYIRACKLWMISILLNGANAAHFELQPTSWQGRVPFLYPDVFRKREQLPAVENFLAFTIRVRSGRKWDDWSPAPVSMFARAWRIFATWGDLPYWTDKPTKGVIEIEGIGGDKHLWILESDDPSREFTIRKPRRGEVSKCFARPVALPSLDFPEQEVDYESCRKFRRYRTSTEFVVHGLARVLFYIIIGVVFWIFAVGVGWPGMLAAGPEALAIAFGLIGAVIHVTTLVWSADSPL